MHSNYKVIGSYLVWVFITLPAEHFFFSLGRIFALNNIFSLFFCFLFSSSSMYLM